MHFTASRVTEIHDQKNTRVKEDRTFFLRDKKRKKMESGREDRIDKKEKQRIKQNIPLQYKEKMKK